MSASTAGCGGIQGPLFEDGSFDFVCIPDNKGVSVHTYGNMVGQGRQAPRRLFRRVPQDGHGGADTSTLTRSGRRSPTATRRPPKRSLRTLRPGDFLVFYCGLQEWDADGGWNQDHRPALYLAGYFEVALAGMAGDFEQKVLQAEFGEELPRPLPVRLQAAEGRLGAGQGRSRQPAVSQGAPDQQRGEGPGGQAAQGAVARHAEGVRRLRGPRLDPAQPAPLGGASDSWTGRLGS